MEPPATSVPSAHPEQLDNPAIENLLHEQRTFPPDPAFTAQANAQADLYLEAETRLRGLLGAGSRASGSPGSSRSRRRSIGTCRSPSGSIGGELNVSYNCVDRHVENGLGNKVAYHWIGEPGDTRTITYADLLREVQKTANALLDALASTTGDRVAIYMPMIPELADRDARVRPDRRPAHGRLRRLLGRGAGRPDQRRRGQARHHRRRRLAARQAGAAQAGGRRGAAVDPDGASNVLVVRRLGDAAPDTAMVDGPRRLVARHRRCASRPTARRCPLDSEHMLYLLYTSGTTAKPKGIFHSSAGYLLGTSYTHEMIFDIKPDDVYWCAADIGWVTGHSYIVYGPLANATTGIMYEGTPDTPVVGALVADHRGVQGQRPVLRPDRDPRLHEAGRAAPRRSTTCPRCGVLGLGRRADQPGSLALVQRARRRRQRARSSTRGGRPRRARS